MSFSQLISRQPSGLSWLVVIAGCAALTMAACASEGRQVATTRSAPAQAAGEPSASGDAYPSAAESAPGQSHVVLADATYTPDTSGTNRASGRGGDALVDRGAELFNKYCTICHGENGDGGGRFAYLMNPRPRNFQKGDFKLSTTGNQVPSDDDLLRTISRGMPGSAMPPWGHLPLTDLQALVKYVRRFHVEATKAELAQWVREDSIAEAEVPALLVERTEPGAPVAVPPESPFDEIRWFRGRRLYLENCASCHGAEGHPVAEAVKFDNEGYPVPPRSFVNGIFKGGSEGHQLYVRIIKGMKGTPMPSSEGLYSADETWDIIHYVQSLARAGAQERAQLKQGTFVAPNIHGPLPSGPVDESWDRARPLYVALTPLWWVEDRIEGLVVQALHNDDELAIRLSWIDPTLDDQAVRHCEFRDGVAIQFSLTSDPPFYMGDPGKHGGVNIWFWKADRQKSIADGYQDVDHAFPDRAVDMYPEQHVGIVDMTVGEWPRAAVTEHDPTFITAWGAGNLVADPNLKTPVECLVARGPGTLGSKPANLQLVQGDAVFERGVWYVQLQRSMNLPPEKGHGDERLFNPGDYLPVSFAIWNGSSGDRDGKKNISIWQKLVIE
ncbi:MAG: ethylbenzene dehydrogenase-related protein [Phycisphaerae bacterium]